MGNPRFRSKNESEVFGALGIIFPNTPIEQEYHVGEGLKVDFLVKSSTIFGIEVDGEQHYCFNPRFHKSAEDFKEQEKRDRRKEELCEKKGICLIRLDARGGISSNVAAQALLKAVKDSDFAADSGEEFTPNNRRRKDRSARRTEYIEACNSARRKAWRKQYRKMKDGRETGGDDVL